MTVTMERGTQITIWSTQSHSTGSETMVIEYNYSDGRKNTVARVKGEEPDVWERPRPDEDGERSSGTPHGTVVTQLGLAGQPVDQDPDFGTLPLGGGAMGSGGFGAALVQDANTGLKVPLNDAANRVVSRVDARLEQME